jgi:predicted ribosome quality control (RQC) complex YloA/Tae2 family protein
MRLVWRAALRHRDVCGPPQHQKGRLRTSTLPGGWQILVGRTDADNDFLNFQVARPDDGWFHVRGMPGVA